MTTTTTLTAEQVKRVKAAIVETQGLLAKEMRYSEDLRKQDKIAFYHAHIAKLENMLLAIV